MDRNYSTKFEYLRKQAEILIQQKPNEEFEQPDNFMELIQELRLHQAELEIQNEELQRAQKELSELHKKYELLYEMAPCGYLTLTPDRIISHANLKAVSLFEQPRKHIINNGFSSFIVKGYEHLFLNACQKSGQSNQIYHSIEFPLRNQNSKLTWVRADIEADRDKNEVINQFRMTLVDITEDRANKEAYKQKATEMEALFNGTKLLLEDTTFENNARKIFDICREITGAQSGYVALLGDNGAENKVLFLESGGFPCDVSPDLPMPIRGLRGEVYTSGNAVFDNNFSTSKWMKFMPKGHVKLKNVLFAPLKNNGKVIGLIGLANKPGDFIQNDLKIVTALGELATISLQQSLSKAALQETEVKLRQSQKMEAIGTLAGGIAHDFNNVLSVVSGNISYLLAEFKNDKALVHVLLDIQEGANKGQAITQQLLAFAKGGAPVKKTIDLNRVLKNIIKFISSGSSTVCKLNASDDVYPVNADENQLHQVFSNIIINATQAMQDGGTITIDIQKKVFNAANGGALPPGEYAYTRISDEGLGIPENHLAKIFDPFFTTKQKGTGLGLSIAFTIIKRHKGVITVESEQGKGTTFHIYLPLSESTAFPTLEKSEIEHRGKGKILVMDDQDAVAKMVGRMLDRMGYETILVKDGVQAIQVYRENLEKLQSFDLVILDLTIPGGMGGEKTMSELLKIDPKVKAIVSSGYSNDPIMSNYEEYGFCGVVPKPYTKSQLSSVLNKIFNNEAET